MNNPVSTYRLQFHQNFTFRDVERIIPYLDKLGVRTIYASPIFEAVPGSVHGYDSVNPQRINPEIGTLAQLKAISQQLAKLGIRWIQDIVPNHMAFHPNNRWLMDVLEKGQRSPYASFFDIDWTSPVHKGRLMVPFLGAPLAEVIDQGELTMAYQDGKFVIRYFETAYPLHLRSYATILTADSQRPTEAVQTLLDQINQLRKLRKPDAYARLSATCLETLAELMKEAKSKAYVRRCLKTVNTTTACLHQIADEQEYRLCYHGETDQQINFRRFFTVNSLICLNIQDPAVFEAVHQLPKTLLEAGVFQGLRVDHIDGLYDPSQYLERLRKLAGDDAYIVVEKILQNDEELPTFWPVQGATGYAYLSMVNNLFTRTSSETSFTRFYQSLLGEKMAVRQELYDKKAYILYEHMNGELDNLVALFQSLNLIDEEAFANVSADKLKAAIGEFLIQCPVYRYYGNQMPLSQPEITAVEAIFARIRKSTKELTAAVDVLEEVLFKKPQMGESDYNERALRFYQRCMQFTGPLMAKGVEDTLMYTYNRFIGHDEVGDSPDYFGLTADEFHQKMIDRQVHWPLALNATSTHDTKRGEDVRSRLNVLTDLTDEWIASVREWQTLNQPLKETDAGNADLPDEGAPDSNDEYFIYQTLVGAYPMPATASASASEDINAPSVEEAAFPDRLTEYLEKAMREAKRNSTYGAPNEAYEGATKAFALQLLDKKRPFWASFRAFSQRIADFGIINSLAQVLLKCTCPGVPDIYQGCEGWDLSLVDPDNRRPVDFALRQEGLDELTADNAAPDWTDLWENRYDARIKLWLIHTLLTERNKHPDLFAKGHYVPLQVEGRYKKHVLAFARRYEQVWYVIAVPLGVAQLCSQQTDDVFSIDWKDTRISLPIEAPETWQNRLLNSDGKVENGIAVAELFNVLPLAVLKMEKQPHERSAGILMPVTSLPSPFGIGDFGPEAFAFADFLSRSRQTYWQVLPLNTIAADCGYSPYSATSSMAGNPLLISPALLVQEGFLDAADLVDYQQPLTQKIDYDTVTKVKEALLTKAYQTFRANQSDRQTEEFNAFREQEAYWLDDFTLFAVLKQQYNNQPWHKWPEAYKLRQANALTTLRNEQQEAIRQVQWFQFVFDNQWETLKTYCNTQGIQLFGDLPFYVNYDSVDVWAHPHLFKLDEEGAMTHVAGVPPDYFNADGQRWGMPIFRWDILQKQEYDWWVRRLRKNQERYDLLRLDHFRAFASYWEVHADEHTAKNGEWKPGPGADFFRTIQNELGELPFVAEDLGKIGPDVYALRDEFGLPGMKVIQFGFGKDMPQTVNTLHHHTPNSIAYTGTHDNNTSRGWYRQDTKKEQIRQLERYVGHSVSEDDVHRVLARLAYASVANTVILPLPDVLGLDESARMNTPASAASNWTWRVLPEQLNPAVEEQLREWTTVYDR
ncbi:malto-oligosyltrehalose synthase [Spirosoma endophyticum]|uniref:4-alpha-glucanotransferase n=1 Tax=Spirosoma endophyticum TaxID=662367 RepID=A0A1I1MPR7_9BACT|nr:malto-oligosyltrehalose synthase [Spirosoma endophyticum]SFC87361.1 4-alpha-glucanotransferase/malto-oligosyltrehalose synthase,TIGR02401 [Spirosoma endophyticum]